MVERHEEAGKPPGNSIEGERLDSWKEIASHFGRDVSTVRRWEKNEGLPVYRHPHHKRSSVYAYKQELETWWGNGHARLEVAQNNARVSLAWLGTVAALAVLALAAALWVRFSDRQLPSPYQDWRITPLTTYSGSERFPSFSPDGSQVAFAYLKETRGDYDIYVKDVFSNTLLPLTESLDSDISPAWSNDGRLIAFYRRFRKDSEHHSTGAIYTISPLGGSERLLLELDDLFRSGFKSPTFQLSWSPDGKLLAFMDGDPPKTPSSIYLLSIESGEKRKLTSPPTAWRGDGTPAFSPDGKTVAFVRANARGEADVYLTSVSGGEPRQLTFDNNYVVGMAWKANGREIVFSSFSKGQSLLWSVPVSGGSPRRLSLGGELGEFREISASGTQLAFGRSRSDKDIWRVQRRSGKQIDSVSKLIVSTRNDSVPAFSSDGSRIAFISNRSGIYHLWVCNEDGSNPVQVTFAEHNGIGPPSWSPNGERIAFHASKGKNVDIYTVGVRGNNLRRLTSHPANERMASWSRDGRWVYFASSRSGSFQVWKVPESGGSAIQVTTKGGYRAVESPDGGFLYYSKGRRTHDVWKVPVGGTTEVSVLEGLKSTWTVVGTGLYFYATQKKAGSQNQWSIGLYDLETGRTNTLAEFRRKPHFLAPPAVSADGGTILFVHQNEGKSDLMLVENFR